MRRSLTSTFGLAVCLLVAAACGSSKPAVDANASAARFVGALNARDVGTMGTLAATPFRFRNQAWQSSPDGSGLVRGAASERIATTAGELQGLLRDVAATVRIADPAPIADPPTKADLLSDNLRDAPGAWSALDLVLFRRGEGDVEHIALVGVDPASGKIAGLYVN